MIFEVIETSCYIGHFKKKFYDLAKYLIDLGSIPIDAILSHALTDGFHIRIDFIIYCMEKEFDISWLYKLPLDSCNNIKSHVGMTDNNEELLKIFKYLASQNHFPLDNDIYEELVHYGYNNCIDFFIECQVIDPEDILITAITDGTEELVESLLKRGVTFNIEKIKKSPKHERIEQFTNIMLDQGYTPMEVLDLIKHLF